MALALDSLIAALPPDLKEHVQLIVSDQEPRVIIDNLLSFALGHPRPQSASDSQSAWERAQLDWRTNLAKLNIQSNGAQPTKRPSDADAEGSSQPKKQKLESSGSPLFTIHGISCSAPVRKKLDVTITSDSISLLHSTSKAIEAVVSLKDLNRAFLLPTPGKPKPHFTLILMNDGSTSGSTGPNELSHVIFGIDATLPSPLKTTSHESSPSTTTHPKNASTLPLLLDFVSHLPSSFAFHDASREKFRSNVSKEECGVTAYIGAKEGHLYFFKEGILWGEKKPCLWYAIGDIAEARAWSVTGKNATLHLEQTVSEPGPEEVKELPPSIEFAMIDGRELDGIKKWIASVKSGFGTPKTMSEPTTAPAHGKAKAKKLDPPVSPLHDAADDSNPIPHEEEDESDGDFNYNSDDSDGGEPSSGSSSESGDQGRGGEKSAEESSEDEEGIPAEPESEGEEGEDEEDDLSKVYQDRSAQFKSLANALAKETAKAMEEDELESE